MAIPSKQIGWGTESNLLYQILKQLNRLTSIIFALKESINPPSVKLTSQVLTQGSWILVGGYYTYSFSNVNVDTTSDVSVTPQNASYQTAYNANVLPYVAVGSGAATFYAQFPPQADMTVDIVITQTF